ncbi:MAG: hypothetical protein AABY32_04065 [Nanoarchaeota archaeon]
MPDVSVCLHNRCPNLVVKPIRECHIEATDEIIDYHYYCKIKNIFISYRRRQPEGCLFSESHGTEPEQEPEYP